MSRDKHRSFSEQDIERWLLADVEDIPLEYHRIRTGDTQRGRRISRYSRMHEGAALAQIALRGYGKSLGHFAAAAAAAANLLERHLRGEEVDRDLLDRYSSRPFSLALAACDQMLIDRLSQLYEAAFPDARTGANDLHWSGAVVAALASGKVDVASEWIATPHPRLPQVSLRYFRALIEGDEGTLRQHCLALADDWKKTIRSERLGKFPDAVCDHIQIGIVRLAERLWGHRPNVDLAAARIPPEIFDAVAERVEGAL